MVLSWPVSGFSSLMFRFAVFPHSSSAPRQASALLISSTSGPGLAQTTTHGHHATNQKCPSYDEPWNSGAGEVKIQTSDFVKECGGGWGRGKKAERAATGRGEVAGSESDQRGKRLYVGAVQV